MTEEFLKGVVHGKTIELEQPSALPDGQVVSVLLRPAPPTSAGEGLRRAFGSWADADEAELTEFLDRIRRDRNASRPEPGP